MKLPSTLRLLCTPVLALAMALLGLGGSSLTAQPAGATTAAFCNLVYGATSLSVPVVASHPSKATLSADLTVIKKTHTYLATMAASAPAGTISVKYHAGVSSLAAEISTITKAKVVAALIAKKSTPALQASMAKYVTTSATDRARVVANITAATPAVNAACYSSSTTAARTTALSVATKAYDLAIKTGAHPVLSDLKTAAKGTSVTIVTAASTKSGELSTAKLSVKTTTSPVVACVAFVTTNFGSPYLVSC
jgi:hypothetical protein